MQEAAADAAREPEPVCQECDGPLESSPFEYDPREEEAPPPDGVHCAGCRIHPRPGAGRPGGAQAAGLGTGSRRGPAMTAYLTESQRRIALALRELTDEAGYPPSIRELADAVALSASTVAYHLQPLELRGVVTHAPHCSRSYQVR